MAATPGTRTAAAIRNDDNNDDDDDDDDNANNVGRNARNHNYPDYDRDEELFGKFLREHTILTDASTTTTTATRRRNTAIPARRRGNNATNKSATIDNNENDDDNNSDNESDLEIPMAPGGDARGSVPRRVACYPPHLHRIQTRQWYDDTEEETNSSNNSNHNSNSNKSHNGVFTIEVPLSELVAWDAVQGGDLAARAARNALRYHDLFCRVIDAHMAAATVEEEETHAAPNHRRSGDEIWHDQRLAQQQQEQNQRQQELAATRASAVNPYAGTGPMEEEEQLQQGQPQNRNANEATLGFPALLMRRYELRILPVGRRGAHPPFRHQQHTASKEDGGDEHAQQVTPVSLRLVRGRHLGSLVTVTGMVVRASDVKPAVTVATYACDACGSELYQVVQNMREFMPVSKCSAQGCNNGGGGRGGGANNAGGSVHLQTRGSKFVKYQELKLQELPNQVPMGHVPRSMPVLCRGELTRQATPGDIVTIDGVFLPQRLAESGYKAMKAGLIATTFLEAQNVTVHKKSYDETASSTSTNMGSSSAALFTAAVRAIATGPDPMGRLASSIAPEIFGHADIKRALLLQLVGGCTRTLPDGMRIRGDVNICLMGDPGVAKSQLLKHVASIAPRGVYTTGKGSSGVGLTAAVTRDLATGEMALEGGALVLADRGICAIDEFDKMDESDRTAIHEVMEQQTVSIAKAGIVATLNARTSVLAAANPLYGRYNRHKSLSENINLPNSLLSRFDLLFLILDTADVDRDTALARHVTLVHQKEGEKATGKVVEQSDAVDNRNEELTVGVRGVIPATVLREYIARARQHHPVMPPAVAPYVVEAYVSLRMQDTPGSRRRSGRNDTVANDQTVMTARQLLSILRLSQAVARLRFSDFVAREDVDEAIRLTHMSKSSLTDDDAGQPGQRTEDVMSRIYNVMRDYSTVSGQKDVELKLCEAMILRKGFTVQQLESCLEEYEALDVIQINATRTHVHFL